MSAYCDSHMECRVDQRAVGTGLTSREIQILNQADTDGDAADCNAMFETSYLGRNCRV